MGFSSQQSSLQCHTMATPVSALAWGWHQQCCSSCPAPSAPHSRPPADLDARRLTRFLLAIEAGYSTQAEVLYHSRTHAADVLQSIFVLMRRGALDKHLGAGQSKQLAVLAAYLAAAVHDYQHVGLSNDFLIRT